MSVLEREVVNRGVRPDMFMGGEACRVPCRVGSRQSRAWRLRVTNTGTFLKNIQLYADEHVY